MPAVTRSQAHLSPRQGDRRRPDRTPLPLTLPMPGYAGFHYDTQHLSPVSAERATECIDAGFIFCSLKSIRMAKIDIWRFSYMLQSLYGFTTPLFNNYSRIESRVTV